MSSFAWLIILVLLLTLVGSLTLVFITVKFYWGERGTPPPTGAERRKQKEEELRLRAAQFEYSKTHPREVRSESFLDNSKSGAGGRQDVTAGFGHAYFVSAFISSEYGSENRDAMTERWFPCHRNCK